MAEFQKFMYVHIVYGDEQNTFTPRAFNLTEMIQNGHHNAEIWWMCSWH